MPVVVIAAVLTLVVTVVRVFGETRGWDPFWFRSDAGSPFAPFGIVWLVPLFGIWFGRRLAQVGAAPRFVTGFFVPMFGLCAIVLAATWILQHGGDDVATGFRYLAIGAPIFALLALFAWPRAFAVSLVYAVLARLPVMAVQYLDVHYGWQTHYGRLPEAMLSLPADERLYVLTIAQLAFWIPFTVLLASGAAAIGAYTVKSR